MKKIFIACLFLASTLANAQAPSMQWVRTINGNTSAQDNPQRSFKDAYGNVYITGWNNNSDIFLVKFDNNGNQTYAVTFNGRDNQWDVGYDVIVDNNGNAYVGGTIDNVWPAVIKFDAQGNKVWEYRTYSVTALGFRSLAFDNASNPSYLYAAGGQSYYDSMRVDKISISTGAMAWSKKIEPGGLTKVKTDGNGNPYICGFTGQNYNTQGYDGFVAKLTASGNLVWKQTFNGVADTADAINNIEILNTGGIIAAGTVYDTTVTSIAWVKLMRLGPTGQVVWSNSYHLPGYLNLAEGDMATNLTKSSFYVGFSARQNGGAGNADAKVVKFDQNGTVQGVATYTAAMGYQDATPVDLEVDNYGNIYTLGGLGNMFSSSAAFLWKIDYLMNTLCSQYYQTLSSSGYIMRVINLHIDNSSHPLGTFMGNISTSATYTDAYFARFNSGCGVDWEVFYNGKANSYDMVNGLVMDNAGNSYVSGTIYDDYTAGDAVVAKYDAQGNQMWANIFDVGQSQDNTSNIVMDAAANVYVLAGNPSPAQLVQYDSAGNQQWAVSTLHNETILAMGSNGTIYAAGGSALNNGNGSGVFLNEFTMTAVDAFGNILGNSTPGTGTQYESYIRSCAVDNNGNAFAGGRLSHWMGWASATLLVQKFNSTGQSTPYYYYVPGIDSAANPAADLAKVVFNPNDGFVYALCSGIPQGGTHTSQYMVQLNTATPSANSTSVYNDANTADYVPTDMAISSANDIYVTGKKTKNNQNYFYVQKWTAGSLAWEKTFFDNTSGPAYSQTGTGLTLDNSGNVYATGNLLASGGWQKQYIFSVKISSAGTVLWQTSYNGPLSGTADDWGQYITTDNNGRVYVAGISTTGSGFGAFDITLLKYCDIPDPQLSASGTVNICNNSSYAIAAPAASSYLWNFGSTSQFITATTAGDYYCTVYEADGCNKNTDTVHVNVISAPVTPDICMVTVDDSSKHNLVLWDKTPYTNAGVIGFNVYREDLTNIYHMVGSVPYANLSQFIDLDPTANPNANTKRYKLTAVDSCGNESQMSNYHNTIYIVSNGGGQFSWNQLYTIENGPNPVVQYILLRDDYNTNTWHAVDSTAGTQFNINDVNFSTFQPTANWRVATQWNITCTPTAKMGGSNGTQSTIVKSKSNISNNRVAGIDASQGGQLGVYPNPAQNSVSVTFPGSSKTTVKLLNLVGEVVTSTETTGATTQLDLSKLAAGIYLLQAENTQGKFVKRVVKE